MGQVDVYSGQGDLSGRVDEKGDVQREALVTSSLRAEGADRIREVSREPLPESHAPYTDKYFLRSAEVLKTHDMNPWVTAQIVVRSGPGKVAGVDQALEIISSYSKFFENGGKAWVRPEGSKYKPGAALLVLEGRIADIIELETMYLGVISAEVTRATDGVSRIDTDEVTERMRAVVAAKGEGDTRPIIYMGARHWRYSEDRAVAAAAFAGGATESSTDIGAAVLGKKGVGTTPHVLENIFAYYHGRRAAVVESTKGFARVFGDSCHVVALIDYDNHEITDSLATARALGTKLFGVRVDTCGENRAEGALTGPDDPAAPAEVAKLLPSLTDPDAKYWYGNGVTITGVHALRKALDTAGFANVSIVLSSGFGDPRKVAAFVRAEKLLGVRLFDTLGVGGVYDSRSAKMDIVAVGEERDKMVAISKAGRRAVDRSELIEYLPAPALRKEAV
jgi:nicotinate phosphoribosyltransferase